METCIRGFSFMPDNKVEVMDMQYIEGDELEKAWKTTRRQRKKEQEQKIWDEFVQEHDIVKNVCQTDPYQFLQNLPEETLKSLLEKELQKMQKRNDTDNAANESNQQESSNLGLPNDLHLQADEADMECDIFHIFEDDELSGQEDEEINDSPCTIRQIRENDNENDKTSNSSLEEKFDKPKFEDSPKLTPRTDDREPEIAVPISESGKSSENVACIIQSSIYCAKVKDIRLKIDEELNAIITSLDTLDLITVDPEVLSKTCKRSYEFCARFNRIYMYQLQRQIQDVRRNNKMTLPFAQHTQFQSQMVRITSLHQNILQALQVFHKSFEQTLCVRDSVAALHTLTRHVRDAADACRASPAPRHFATAKELYDDEVLVSCDKLDTALENHAIKSDSILKNSERLCTQRKSSAKFRGKKRSIGNWSKSGSKSVIDKRLSMYSMDTLRINLNPKPTNSKESSTNKTRVGTDATPTANASANKSKFGKGPNSQRKTPKLRREERARAAADCDVQTMVQSVSVCESAILGHDVTPIQSPVKDPTYKRVPRKISPRRRTSTSFRETPRTSITSTPRCTKRSPNRLKNSQQCQTILKLKTKLKGDQSIKNEANNMSSILSPGVKEGFEELAGDKDDVKVDTPRPETEEKKSEIVRDTHKVPDFGPEVCDVTTLLKKLCSGDSTGSKIERVSGAKNAQLVCINGANLRQPSTPQLLRILEETIQKKAPRPYYAKSSIKDQEKLRLTFNISQQTADKIFQYRTKFVQHMLASPLYANSVVGKPWETIGNLSEKIIEEILMSCVKEMEIRDVVNELYKCETR